MANCKAADVQFADATACMTACATVTTPGTAADTAGNTIGCHLYHANAAATTPDVHCWHAGIPSYNDSTKASPGPCVAAGG
jgi:hypothetical protein